MKDIKFIMILFILLIVFVILLANNVKKVDRETRVMSVDWESYTCNLE